MFKDITLGQYYPTGSVIHQLDPRTKINFTLVYIVLLFVVNNPVGYLIAIGILALVIALSWVFFMTGTPGEAAVYFARLFGHGAAVGSADALRVLRSCWPYLALGLAGSTPLPSYLWARVRGRGFAWVLLFALFWVCMYFLATAASDPFLYFSF